VRIDAHRRFQELPIEARKSAGLTQAEISQRLKRPQSFVSKYERGERRVDVVKFGDVAKALGMDPFASSIGFMERDLEDCRCHYSAKLWDLRGFPALSEDQEADSRRSQEMRMARRQRKRAREQYTKFVDRPRIEKRIIVSSKKAFYIDMRGRPVKPATARSPGSKKAQGIPDA
jgi:transcriptional regulator with XRE-family HTH domain